jgi:hypoxanthine phosphoribosyltransferase
MIEKPKFLTLDWHDIKEILMKLAQDIVKKGYTPQAVVGIMRGGWIPARILSDLLDVHDIGAIEIKFYRGIEERGERPVVTQPLLLDVRDKNVLIVDDVVDTGKSLQVAINAISLQGPKGIRSASLYTKPWSLIKPDFCYGETDKWIIFPWEVREVIEEIVLAEYKTIPRATEALDQVSNDISEKTGLDKQTVIEVLRLMVDIH